MTFGPGDYAQVLAEIDRRQALAEIDRLRAISAALATAANEFERLAIVLEKAAGESDPGYYLAVTKAIKAATADALAKAKGEL